MAMPMEELGARQGWFAEYDDESGYAALDLLRLLMHAKRFVTDPTGSQPVGSDRLEARDRLRSQLAESIFDECLLFDERTVCALLKFFSAWRGAAYGRQSNPQVVDTALERTYRQALEALRPYLIPALQVARDSLPSAAGSRQD